MNRKEVQCMDCAANCIIKNIYDEQVLKEIEESKTVQHYNKQQYIFNEGMPISQIRFITSGVVKVFKSGVNNKTKIIRFSKTGEILGHRALNTTTYPVSAVAIEETTICSFSKIFYLNLIRKNLSLAIKMMNFFADELTRSETRERNLAQMNVREKIADTLLYLKDTFELDKNNVLQIFLSRQDIADYAGTTKEQVSKILSEFKDEKLIKLKAKQIIFLDEQKIRTIIDTHFKHYL
ncbi:MAG: Crp/Fnr family transcriptional regulator [Bacteroidia bacterium]